MSRITVVGLGGRLTYNLNSHFALEGGRLLLSAGVSGVADVMPVKPWKDSSA